MNIKNILKGLLLTGLFLGSTAHASYVCQAGKEAKLVIQKAEGECLKAGFLHQALLVLKDHEQLCAKLVENKSDFFGKNLVYSLQNLSGEEVTSVTISKFLKQCGRGSCDTSAGMSISALLKLPGQEIFLSCHEDSN